VEQSTLAWGGGWTGPGAADAKKKTEGGGGHRGGEKPQTTQGMARLLGEEVNQREINQKCLGRST